MNTPVCALNAGTEGRIVFNSEKHSGAGFFYFLECHVATAIIWFTSDIVRFFAGINSITRYCHSIEVHGFICCITDFPMEMRSCWALCVSTLYLTVAITTITFDFDHPQTIPNADIFTISSFNTDVTVESCKYRGWYLKLTWTVNQDVTRVGS